MKNKLVIDFWKWWLQRSLQDAESDELISYTDGSDIPDDVVALFDHQNKKEIQFKIKVIDIK